MDNLNTNPVNVVNVMDQFALLNKQSEELDVALTAQIAVKQNEIEGLKTQLAQIRAFRGVKTTVKNNVVRQKNEHTLKEVVVSVLPSAEAPLSAKDMADKVLATGYKTNSKTFTNNVRVVLLALALENKALAYDDGTYSVYDEVVVGAETAVA